MKSQLKTRFDIRKSFATAFANWRRKNQIPLKQIAIDLGVSISTVSAWEHGTRFPSGKNLEQLLAYTGLLPCRLFCVMADVCMPEVCLAAAAQIASQDCVSCTVSQKVEKS